MSAPLLDARNVAKHFGGFRAVAGGAPGAVVNDPAVIEAYLGRKKEVVSLSVISCQ